MAAPDLDLFLTSELNDTEQRALRRMARAGEVQRVAPTQAAGIYSGQPASEWLEQIRRHRVRVLSHLFPNGILSYRSAFEGSLNAEKLFLSFKYRKTVKSPAGRSTTEPVENLPPECDADVSRQPECRPIRPVSKCDPRGPGGPLD